MLTARIIKLDEALPVLSHPAIFHCIAPDGYTMEDLLEDECINLGVFDGDELVSVWCLNEVTFTTLEIHAHVLPEHRKNKYRIWRVALGCIQDLFPVIHKLQAKIPVCYPAIYRYAKNNGMLDEGIERESILINGKHTDLHLVGNTVTELGKVMYG